MPFIDSDLSALMNDKDFISTDGYLDFALQNQDFHYSKRDFLFHSGVWRGEPQKALIRQHSGAFKAVIIGHSDHYLTSYQARLLSLRGVRHIFATNATPLAGLVTPIPQGLTNDCDDSPAHRILGNSDLIMAARSIQPVRDEFRASCYVNFAADTSMSIRSAVVRFARSIPNSVF